MTHEFHSFYYDRMGKDPMTGDFAVPAGTEMTPELLRKLIDEYENNHVPRLSYLSEAYDTHYEVFGMTRKPDHKPDNRLAADMAYDITETFEGYFIGIPVDCKYRAPDGKGDEAKSEYIRAHVKRNFQDDVDADLSKMASKFGLAYEMMYQDEEGLPRSVALSPMTSFMVYDDSVLHRKLFFVRYGYDDEGHVVGSYSDAHKVYSFDDMDGVLKASDGDDHSFGEVPAIRFQQNTEMRGLYEGVLNLIEAYNRVLSEKANDIEYFSDAYMLIKGMKLPEGWQEDLRKNKVINVYNQNGEALEVCFIAKPDADAAQEHLIDRLEMLIFKMAMVPDITDESFSTASGIALKMRLMPMGNLARNKERKFVTGVQERMRMLSRYPLGPLEDGDWENVEVVMHRNMPEDIASEVQVAGQLSGIVSEETQLGVLSIVDDPKGEIERRNEEREARVSVVTDGLPTNRTGTEPAEGE